MLSTKIFNRKMRFVKYETTSVIVDNNLANHLNWALTNLNNIKNYVMITDSNVHEIVFPKIRKELSFLEPLHVLPFPAGEQSKTDIVKHELENTLNHLLIDKHTVIIALGGGVVSDLAGYIAATYRRGIPLINIPTSLIGMIDAGLGGKVGINTSAGKNLVGYIKHPVLTLINTRFLASLPEKELLNGVIEAFKYAVIASPRLFSFIKQYHSLFFRPETHIHTMKTLVQTCCRIKMNIVKQDPEDNGIRRILNFGHTTAHALETVSGYTLSHGEAVAIGMKVAVLLSLKQGYLSPCSATTILSLLETLYEKRKLQFSVDAVKTAMLADKKCFCKNIRFVLLKNLGETIPFEGMYCSDIPLSILDPILEQVFEGS